MIRDRALILSLVAATLCGLLLTPRLSLAEEGPPAETAAPTAEPAGETPASPEATEAEVVPEATSAAEGETPEVADAEEPAPAPVEIDDDTPTPGEEPARQSRGSRFRQMMSVLPETGAIFSINRGSSSLGIIGSMQLLAIHYIADPMASIESHSIANAEGFRLRRARFGIGGNLPFYFGYRLIFELGDEGANILDANLSFEPFSLVRVTAGALKVPFSRIMMQSSEYQTFLQRPYIVRSVAPDRALGLEVSGQMTWFTYNIGIFNGGGDYYRGDNNAGMLYAIRAVGHPWGPLPRGEITLPRRFLLHVAASYFYNQDATGGRHAVCGELAMRWQRISFAAEVIWSQFNPAGSPETGEDIEYGNTEHLGWYVEAGYFIFREHLQVMVRYEGQYVSEAVEIQDMNDLWAISGSINGYMLRGRIKLSLQYEHRHEWFDDQVRNDFFAIQLQGRL